jgi:hypothetical protein
MINFNKTFLVLAIMFICIITLLLQLGRNENKLIQATTKLQEIRECLGWKHIFRTGEGNPRMMDERQCNSYGIDIMESYY